MTLEVCPPLLDPVASSFQNARLLPRRPWPASLPDPTQRCAHLVANRLIWSGLDTRWSRAWQALRMAR